MIHAEKYQFLVEHLGEDKAREVWAAIQAGGKSADDGTVIGFKSSATSFAEVDAEQRLAELSGQLAGLLTNIALSGDLSASEKTAAAQQAVSDFSTRLASAGAKTTSKKSQRPHPADGAVADLKRMVSPQRGKTKEQQEMIEALKRSKDPAAGPLLQLFEGPLPQG
jgi:hypothetical protein